MIFMDGHEVHLYIPVYSALHMGFDKCVMNGMFSPSQSHTQNNCMAQIPVLYLFISPLSKTPATTDLFTKFYLPQNVM